MKALGGFSTIELLIAFALLISAVATVTLTVDGIPNLIAHARMEHEAYRIADYTLLSLWNNIRTKEQGAQVSLRINQDGYEIATQAGPRANGLYTRLVALVSWAGVRGQPAKLSLQGVAVDLERTRSSTCSPFVIGDWFSPRVLGTYRLSSDSLLPAHAGDSAVSDIAVLGSRIAIAIPKTDSAESPTLHFFTHQASDERPVWETAFDNAPGSQIGFSALAVGDGYLFAGNGFGSASGATSDLCKDGYSCAQLQVFDLSPSVVPERIGALELSTSTWPRAVTVRGARAAVASIVYGNGLVFLGLEKTANGMEFVVIDATDPAHPRWLSGLPLGRSVRAIAITENYAYLATSDSKRELLIVDITDPRQPMVVDSWDASGASGFGLGSAVYVQDGRAHVGRTYVSNASEWYAFDEVEPAHLVPFFEYDLGTARRPASVVDIIVRDFLAFVLSGNRLLIADFSTPDLASPVILEQSIPGSGAALACRGNTLYVLSNKDGIGALSIITSS